MTHERTEEEKAALRSAGFGITPDGRAVFGYDNRQQNPPGVHTITIENARDTAKYQAARSAAADEGVQLQIIDPAAPPRPVASKGNFEAPEPVTITKSQARDTATYRAAKAKAQESGVPLQLVEDAAEA